MFIPVLALQINRALICRNKGLASQAHCIIANAIICLIAFVRVYYSVDVSVCMWFCAASPPSAECWHVAPSRWGTLSAPRCVACSPSSDWSAFPVWSAGLACLPPSCSAPASAALSAESQSHTIRNCFTRLSAIAGGAWRTCANKTHQKRSDCAVYLRISFRLFKYVMINSSGQKKRYFTILNYHSAPTLSVRTQGSCRPTVCSMDTASQTARR